MTIPELQQYVYDFLYDRGLPHISICAVMGNITGESTWDPNIEESNGVGLGLCQWSFGRRTQLEAYGITVDKQCNFLWAELSADPDYLALTGADNQWLNPPAENTSNGPFNCPRATFLSGDGTIQFLTSAFCFCWERPNYELSHLDTKRIPAAIEFVATMSYHGGGTPTGELYSLIEATPYITSTLKAEQIVLLSSLNVGDNCKIRYTYNKRKRVLGYTSFSKKLTLSDFTYIIRGVDTSGFVLLSKTATTANILHINPQYIMEE